ncbi:hypothetical protein ACKVEX_05750 [Rhodocyclaceae bacterium SMB388]
MTNIFDKLGYEEAGHLERLTRLAYELREHRRDILATHDVDDEPSLLKGIVAGQIPEHPGYEHYLAARILAETREQARQLLADGIAEAQRS